MFGKIKNLTQIFKRYQNPYLSLYNRLVAPDIRSDNFITLQEKVQKYKLYQAYLHPIRTILCGSTI